MTLARSVLIGAAFWVGATVASQAQYQTGAYNQYQSPPPYRTSPVPPSWSYNPYTSGLGPCPQRLASDSESCREQMPPTFGQPDLRPH